jgi:hypothetical protein
MIVPLLMQHQGLWLLWPGRIDIPVTTEAVTMVAMASRAIADEAVTREGEREIREIHLPVQRKWLLLLLKCRLEHRLVILCRPPGKTKNQKNSCGKETEGCRVLSYFNDDEAFNYPSVQALRKNNVAAKPSDLCLCAQWRAVRDNVLRVKKEWNVMEANELID